MNKKKTSVVAETKTSVTTKKEERRETRKIVTPYAFQVSSELLGKPLAKPVKRGLAMTIDGVVLAFLSQASGYILAGIAAATFFRAGNRLKQKNDFKGAIIGLRFLTIVLTFIFSVGFYGQFFSGTPPTETKQEVTVSFNEMLAGLLDNPENKQDNPSILRWVQGALNDLGLGLGWATFYFSILTAWWKGQTIGKKILGIKVIKLDNSTLNLWESFGRYGGYGAGIATGLLGFIQIYWDPNRRAIQDKISDTLVIDIRRN